MSAGRRRWTWHFSSLFYRFSYIGVAHRLDQDLLAYLGDRVREAVVADGGCGPGVVVEKFLKREAAQVFAIDANGAMLRQVGARLADAVATGAVVAVQRPFCSQLFQDLRYQSLNERGFDIVLFKRSLYLKRHQALPILKAAVESLEPGGVLAVVYGDRSVRRYAGGPGLRPASYTVYHLLNRAWSKLGEALGVCDYNVYTRAELLDLLRAAAPNHPVELIRTRQRPYNLAAVLA